MNCDVFDTYVTKPDGEQMHFDVIVPSGTAQETAIAFGQNYLAEVGVKESKVTAERCRFCHVEQATPEMQQAMEGCPPVAAN